MILWAYGSSKFRPPNFLLRKILFCTRKVVVLCIGKMLLWKDVFDGMSVLAIMTLPYSDSIFGERLFICFSIFSVVISQFRLFAFCKPSLKYIPNIFIISFWYFIVISLGTFVVISVFIGNTVWSSRKKLESSAYCHF